MRVLKCWGAGVRRCLSAVVLVGAVIASPMDALAQVPVDGDRVMTAVRAALAPALPFPDTDESGTVPADNRPDSLWMVRPLQPGERSIEVMANPLNAINQARATRAMAQIGAAIDAAQRRAELQYERAISEAKRTGRSQEVDGVGLSDEGVAGARIDAEAHVTIDVDFNQPAYSYPVESSVAPAPSRVLVVPGAVAVITTPSNTYRLRSAQRTEERFAQADTIVFLGAVGMPDVGERSEHAFEVAATAAQPAAGLGSLTLRFRGNEVLIADLVSRADWAQVQELLK